ncbi:endonuclease [Caulobacter sp. Root1455]|uniref:endonuclease/exonuclease/phosphatase family protein n=1 Tax=Caulobacter sp. Root1455 TaxID=1736465 RepID=UPI0006F48A48|nr:endonuclease/exonuclease/phosphatase family protein [Caulobacter sp. Root1455]KQZ05861.1 endonuclease [Caulobacter sp. Root1455]
MRLVLNLASLFVRGTALMFALVGATTGLLCLGGVFNDKLDALTHWAVIWLACGVAGLVLGAAFARDTERKAIVGLSLVAVLATGGLMTPEIAGSWFQKTKPKATPALKLVQFNLWAGNHHPEATLAWILAQKADVVTIQEAGGAAWPVVAGLLKAYPYRVSCDGARTCDTWIFSRWPMTQKRGFLKEGLPLAGATAVVQAPSGAFPLAAVHYVWPIPAGRQQAQSRLLVSRLAPFPRQNLIVAGDFNSTPWSFSLRRQDKALGLERRTRALASWPSGDFSRVARAPFPILPIDHVYAGKAWKTVKVERGPNLGSDHRPVVVTLAR